MTDGAWKFKLHVIMHAHAHTYAHNAYTYMNTHMHAHTCTLASPAALEAYLPKGTRVDQVKANNPRKKM